MKRILCPLFALLCASAFPQDWKSIAVNTSDAKHFSLVYPVKFTTLANVKLLGLKLGSPSAYALPGIQANSTTSLLPTFAGSVLWPIGGGDNIKFSLGPSLSVVQGEKAHFGGMIAVFYTSAPANNPPVMYIK